MSMFGEAIDVGEDLEGDIGSIGPDAESVDGEAEEAQSQSRQNSQSAVSGPSVRVNVRDFRDFAKALRRARPVLAKSLRAELRAAGEEVASKARANASWSTRIPGSIRTSVRGASVSVTAGGKKAPHAAPLENDGKGGTFRHPVFGRDVWVSQRARPFLEPALKEGSEAASRAAVNALDKAISEATR